MATISGLACCATEEYSLTELLVSPIDTRTFQLVTVDSVWLGEKNTFNSRATVDEVFKNPGKSDIIYIKSGGRNSSTGGTLLKKGSQYLLVGWSNDGLNFSAFVCDVFSHEIGERYSFDDRFNRMEVIRNYADYVKSLHTGKVVLKTHGKIIAEGRMKNGIPHGKWKHLNRSEANFDMGLHDGLAIKYSKAENDILLKHRTWYSKNKVTRSEFQRMGDFGVYISDEATNEYLADYIISTAIRRHDKGVMREVLTTLKHTCMLIEHPSHYEIKHGPYKKFNDTGVLQVEGNYWHGAKIGTWRKYKAGGELASEKNYEYPVAAEDSISIFYENGILRQQGKTINKKAEGDWKFFNKDGVHERSEFYKDGMDTRERKRFYTQTGQLLTSYFIKRNGKYENRLTEYYSNGNVKVKIDFSNGKINGIHEKYAKNGRPKMKCNYKMGKLDGMYSVYDNSGLIIEQGRYEFGQKMGRWKKYVETYNCYRIFDFGSDRRPEGYTEINFSMLENLLFEDLDGNVLSKDEIMQQR